MPSYDTIVVGMGVAGLTAAAALANTGRRVLGLEAQAQIGGRVRTEEFGDGVVEMGAEWIHGQLQNPIYELMKNEINKEGIQQDIVFKFYKSEGRPLPEEMQKTVETFVKDIFNLIEKDPQVPPGKPISQADFAKKCIADYLEKYQSVRESLAAVPHLQEGVVEFIHLICNNYSSCDQWSEVSAAEDYTMLNGHQNISWGKDGYKMLLDIIMNLHDEGPGVPLLDLKLNMEVIQVNWMWKERRVRVKVKSGKEFQADNVVVTVSLGVLKDTHKRIFNPALPTDKIVAIESMKMGVMDKIHLSFEEAWWPKTHTCFGFIWMPEHIQVMAKEDRWMCRIFGATASMGSSNVLTLWTSGAEARLAESLSEEVVKQKAMTVLQIFMGAGRDLPHATGIKRSTWHSNPFTRGSYTFDPVEYNRDWRKNLAVPINDEVDNPLVLFAGEATSSEHFSTVHGAYETGMKVANTLIAVVREDKNRFPTPQ